jgi:hypothetical protein
VLVGIGIAHGTDALIQEIPAGDDENVVVLVEIQLELPGLKFWVEIGLKIHRAQPNPSDPSALNTDKLNGQLNSLSEECHKPPGLGQLI